MLQYRTEARRGYLYVAVNGEIDLAGAKSSYSAMLQEAIRDGHARILLDLVRVTGDWQPAHRLAFGVYMAEEHERIAKWPQVAILAAPPLMDPGRFTQMVANNRGVHLRTSDSLQELLSWLGV